MKYLEIKELTRKLRSNSTLAEEKLWKYIRNRKLCGRKFLRQHAIIYDSIGNEHFFYVPDFYCFEENLAIELDGKIHDFSKEHDAKRDEILEMKGIKVLRIKNKDLNEMEKVLSEIKSKFKQ